MSYFQQLALAGKCFIGSAPIAGIDIPISTGTTPVFGLWNPLGSGVNLVLNSLMISTIDATTPVISGLALSYVPNTGSTVATGAPIATHTAVQPLNALISTGPNNKARFNAAASGTTLTTAGTVFYAIGLGHESVTPAVGSQVFQHLFNGAVIVPQGVFIHLVGNAAQTENMLPTITWAEVAA
jgi:hypothetical protein